MFAVHNLPQRSGGEQSVNGEIGWGMRRSCVGGETDGGEKQNEGQEY